MKSIIALLIALALVAIPFVFAPLGYAHAAELPPQPTAAPMIGHLEPVQPTPVERPEQPEIVLDMVALNEAIVSDALTTITIPVSAELRCRSFLLIHSNKSRQAKAP